jgi:hypothetical protein
MEFQFSPTKRRMLDALPKLDALDPDKLVAVSNAQLALLAAVPLGSVSALAKRDLTPAVPNSQVYRCGDLKKFRDRHLGEVTRRIAVACAAKFDRGDLSADPAVLVQEHLAAIMDGIIADKR